MSDIILRGDPNTLRILEFDGGGERGYLSDQFFKLLIEGWGINDDEVWKYFDVICGTSIGGIITLALAAGIPLSTIEEFFTSTGKFIFSLSSIIPSLRPNSVEQFAFISQQIPFYQSSGPTEDDYGAGLLRKTIRELLGSITLKELKTNVIIPTIRKDPIINPEDGTTTYKYTFVTFSNIDHPEFEGMDELASDIALCTSAAPVYLPEYTFVNSKGETHTYIDGGIFQNNPAIFGRNIAQIIKPTLRRTCILSIGTGLGAINFDLEYEAPPPEDPPIDPPEDPPEEPSLLVRKKLVSKQMETFIYGRKYGHSLSKESLFDDPTVDPIEIIGNLLDAIKNLKQLFTLAMTGGQESVARSLYLESEYGGNQLYHYRFQPELDPTLDTELDNTDDDILQYYRDTAQQWYDEDITNITNFLGHLRR
jgi:hypothetical protein